ncbi:MAG: hypothetical protein HY897_13835 [Deltaproteobacteria bacterium]|nr:hypothetical protein [Deltaproteobacteria bacterium]
MRFVVALLSVAAMVAFVSSCDVGVVFNCFSDADCPAEHTCRDGRCVEAAGGGDAGIFGGDGAAGVADVGEAAPDSGTSSDRGEPGDGGFQDDGRHAEDGGRDDAGSGGCGGEVDCPAVCLLDQECSGEADFDLEGCVEECIHMVPKLLGSYIEFVLGCYDMTDCEDRSMCSERASQGCPHTAETEAYVDTVCVKLAECDPGMTVEWCRADMEDSGNAATMNCLCPATVKELSGCIAAVDCANVDAEIDACYQEVAGN